MDEYTQDYNKYRDFFKYCTTTVFNIYEHEQTEPRLYMEESDGQCATLYVMGQYGRIVGIQLFLIDSQECHFIIEIKNKLKMTDFKLHISDTCSYSLIDLVYLVLLVCDHPEALHALNEYCDTYDKDRPRNLLLDWDNDPTWYLLQSDAGKDFMLDNQLEFKPACEHIPLNELTMNIPTTRGEYTVQRIQTGVRGRLSIHHIESTRVAFIMDPAGGLSSMFSQYLRYIETLNKPSGSNRMPGTTRVLYPHITSYLHNLIMQARTLTRFGLKTEEDITTTIHNLICD